MMRQLAATALAGVMFVASGAIAATDSRHEGALAAGQRATVQEAQHFHGSQGVLLLAGAGLVIAGIVLVATGNGNGTSNGSTDCTPDGQCPPVTTTTNPPPTTTTTTTTTTGTP